MALTSRTLTVKYVGDDSQLRKTIAGISSANQSLSSKLQNVGKSMFRTGRTISAGITLPLVAMGKVAVDEFTPLQHVNAQTAAALKSTGGAAHVTVDQIHNLSSSLGTLTAQDGEAVQQTENLLLTFTNLRNEAGKGNDIFNQTSLAVQNVSAAMGQDAKSSAIQLGKALSDPIAGLTSLKRIGVTFSAAQQKQIAKLMEQNDLLGAQKLILGEVTKEFGGSAKALGDTASPATKLNLAFRDMAESLGKVLVPILNTVTGWLSKLFAWFEQLSPSTKKWIVVAGLLLAALGPVLMILGALVTVIGVLISPITLVVLGIAALVFAFYKWRRVTMIILTVLFPIIGLIRLIAEHFQGFKQIVAVVWAFILERTRTVWQAIKGLVIDPVIWIKDHVIEAFNLVKEKVVDAWNWVKDKVGAIIDWIADKIAWLIDKLETLTKLLPKGVGGGAVTGGLQLAGNIPHAASGGIVRRPTVLLAGEAGPEAIIPLGRIRGGGGTVININVAGSVLTDRDLAETVRREFVKVSRRNGGALGVA
jgi:hypothetical protein